MIRIYRLAEPQILVLNKSGWTTNFINSNKSRPDNSKYGHRDIKIPLYSVSFNKCYYCERLLKDSSKEIDHFIEVSEAKDLAFEWTNLHLACDNCNGKISNRVIPVTNVLNPCTSTDSEIEGALMFDDEQITAVPNSQIGFTSIMKYKLNSELLDRLRGKRLNIFNKELHKIKDKLIAEGRQYYTEDELRAINRFANRDQPYSLMFKLLLKELGFTGQTQS